jgi:hypothetical protein
VTSIPKTLQQEVWERGRARVVVQESNLPYRVALRSALILEGVFPP